MSDIRIENDGSRYLFTIIDCFSKYAWAIPLKRKDADTVSAAFDDFLKKNSRKPQLFQTDKGKEFVNSKFILMLKSHHIKHFTTNNEEIKAAIVERFNRTLKSEMYRYFTHTTTKRYIDILPKLLTAYNNSYHRTIGMTPNQVDATNSAEVFSRMYSKDISAKLKAENKSAKHLEANEIVRISQYKNAFRKGYEPQWSNELYKITHKRDDRLTPAQVKKSKSVYGVKDMRDEELTGTFYPEELQKIGEQSESQTLKEIQKILKYRGVGAAREAFVKWKGLHRKFNCWVPVSHLKL
jgi:hypothetical protein